MATSAKLNVVPGRSEQGSSFFRRTTSNMSFRRVPFLEIGTGASIPCNCVIELHGHPGTGKTFSFSEMAVEALISSGSAGSKGSQRTVLWFDADLKFNPNCIIKCAERAAGDFSGDADFEDILSRIIVFKPADVLQLVATLQSMRLGAGYDDFADIGIPIMVIVDGVSPLFCSSRAAGDTAPNMFDQVCAAIEPFQSFGLIFIHSSSSNSVPSRAAAAVICPNSSVVFLSRPFRYHILPHPIQAIAANRFAATAVMTRRPPVALICIQLFCAVWQQLERPHFAQDHPQSNHSSVIHTPHIHTRMRSHFSRVQRRPRIRSHAKQPQRVCISLRQAPPRPARVRSLVAARWWMGARGMKNLAANISYRAESKGCFARATSPLHPSEINSLTTCSRCTGSAINVRVQESEMSSNTWFIPVCS